MASYNYIDTPPIVHYATLVLVILSLVLSGMAYLKVNEIHNLAVPADPQDIHRQLSNNEGAESLQGQNPLGVQEITAGNLATLQSQIAGLDTSYVGDYLVQYQGVIVLYDPDDDVIRGTIDTSQLQQAQQQQLTQQQQQQLAQDLFAKLYAHPEVAGLQGQQPQGGQLDQQTLASLQQQLPQVYGDAEVGDFLLRYSDRIVIYDYQNDEIINIVPLNQ